MFTKCLRPICHQYARTYYQNQLRQTRDAILIAFKNVESRVNLDPQDMDTCVGCRIVEYLLTTVFLLWVRAFYYNNINRPYDVRKYSLHPWHAWFLQLLEVNVLCSEHLIYHKNH